MRWGEEERGRKKRNGGSRLMEESKNGRYIGY